MNFRKLLAPWKAEKKNFASGPLIALEGGRRPQWMSRNIGAFEGATPHPNPLPQGEREK
jgi:hypothetical protein